MVGSGSPVSAASWDRLMTPPASAMVSRIANARSRDCTPPAPFGPFAVAPPERAFDALEEALEDALDRALERAPVFAPAVDVRAGIWPASPFVSHARVLAIVRSIFRMMKS
jgi:hypothetical protein